MNRTGEDKDAERSEDIRDQLLCDSNCVQELCYEPDCPNTDYRCKRQGEMKIVRYRSWPDMLWDLDILQH